MQTIESLVLDLTAFVAREPRTYAEVMDAWRTSCPRLAVWEEATDRGLVRCEPNPAGALMVRVTKDGEAFLRAQRPVVMG